MKKLVAVGVKIAPAGSGRVHVISIFMHRVVPASQCDDNCEERLSRGSVCHANAVHNTLDVLVSLPSPKYGEHILDSASRWRDPLLDFTKYTQVYLVLAQGGY